MDAAHHRQIELQYPEDFAYLVDNVRRAAAESVAAAFPPVADDGRGGSKDSKDGKDGKDGKDSKARRGTKKSKKRGAAALDEEDEDDDNDRGDDDLHTRVEALVNEYIQRTFYLAAPNLTINGMPVDPRPYWADEKTKKAGKRRKGQTETEEKTVYAPFDARLRQRVEDLARDEEDLLRDLAALKRRVPPAVVQAHTKRWDAALQALDEAAPVPDPAADAGELASLADSIATTDTREMAASFGLAVSALGRLKQAMPATVARMERARVAGEYALAKR